MDIQAQLTEALEVAVLLMQELETTQEEMVAAELSY
jgi:hypothetical protein